MKPICLYGFMGCGKSYAGHKAASETGLSYLDLDEYIANREGISIPEIFSKSGEEYFRSLELSALREVKANIISLGGGALTNHETAAYAKENVIVIFIDTPFEVCYKRIKNDLSRPNAANKTKEELFMLYKSREEQYRNAADYTEKKLNRIINLIKELTNDNI